MKTDSNPTGTWDSRVNDLFLQAVEIVRGEAREAFLVEQCGDNADLRRRLDSMLDAAGKAEGYFEKPDGVLDAVASMATADSTSLYAAEGSQIDRYKLLQRIGEGGFGIVYMVEQEQPVRRQVALKVIKPGMDTREVIARFEAERQALAMMDHPNIAKVLDAGTTADKRPYFVMELVKGVPITEFCDKNNLTTRERLDLFLRVCSAVQHAHQKGVIHRDIKPSNVMITLHDSEPVPKIIDFGIAKAISQRLTERTLFTRYGQMIGTPQYMSPEQAEMSGLDIDTRSDVYSLGVLLYELLTGTTPLDAERMRSAGYAEIVKLVQEEEPPPPSQRISTLGEQQAIIARRRGVDANSLRRKIRGDLDWIVMKSIEKDRRRRYDTASSFAEDIKRYIEGDTVYAVAPSVGYRFKKFIARHRLYVTTGILLSTTLLITTGVSIRQALIAWEAQKESRQAQSESESATVEAVAQRAAAERSASQVQQLAQQQRLELYASDMARADRYLADGNLPAVKMLLERHQHIDRGMNDLRGFEWKYLQMKTKGDFVHTIDAVGHEVSTSPDGRFFAHRFDSKVIVREQHAPWLEVQRIDSVASSLSFSPDGRFLAAGSDSDVSIFATSDGSLVKKWDNAHGPVKFSHDGKLIAFVHTDALGHIHELRLLEVRTWEQLDQIPAKPFGMDWWQARDQLEFSHDGKWLITLGGPPRGPDFQWQFYRLDQKKLDPDFLKHVPPGSAISMSPDGKHFAVGRWEIEIWDVERQAKIATLGRHRSFITRIEYSPDGKYLVTTGSDKQINVWSSNGYGHVQTLLGSEGEVWGLSITTDSQFILNAHFADKNRSVKIWPMEPKSEVNELIAGFPIGTTQTGELVVGEFNGQIRGWHGDRETFNFHVGAGQVSGTINFFAAACTTPEDQLLVGMEDGGIRIWDLKDQTFQGELTIEQGAMVRCVASHPTKHEIFAVGNANGSAAIWDLERKEKVATLLETENIRGVHFSRDGLRLAVRSSYTPEQPKCLRVFDISTTAPRELYGVEGNCHSMDFSPDGKYVAAGLAAANRIIVLDAESGKQLTSLEGSLGAVDSLSFSPDGKTLVTACNNNIVKLWHVPTWIEMVSIKSPEIPVVFFPPGDSERLIMGSRVGGPVHDLRVPSLSAAAFK